MSNFERCKNVESEGFATVEEARDDARAFVRTGGKVSEGGERADGTFGWTGKIAVEDSSLSLDGSYGCGRCATTGRFITGTMNGKPTGPGGDCFRCNGKGYHDRADRKRNWGYDRYGIRILT